LQLSAGWDFRETTGASRFSHVDRKETEFFGKPNRLKRRAGRARMANARQKILRKNRARRARDDAGNARGACPAIAVPKDCAEFDAHQRTLQAVDCR
jgi:hypothetical protein